MNLSDAQYDRIARRLDGEDVELTAVEQAAADEILRHESRLSGVMDAAPSREAVDRAKRRMMAELARPARRTIWRRGVLRVALATAAAVLLVAIFRPGGPEPPAKTTEPISLEELVPLESPGVDEFDLLAGELNKLDAQFRAAGVGMDLLGESMDALEFEIEAFWLDETLLSLPLSPDEV